MQPVSYTRYVLTRRKLSINKVMNPTAIQNNFAVFGGTEEERIAVVMHGLRRSINNHAIIVVHDSFQFEQTLLHTFRPVTQLSIGHTSFDPLIGVNRSDAMQVRQTLSNALNAKKLISLRVPSTDQSLQRMLASELLGLSYNRNHFLLVLFGFRQPSADLVKLAVGTKGGNYSTAIAGPNASSTIGQECLPDLLQSNEEILFLPSADMHEAQHISNCFGSYMRIQPQQTIQRRGIWPFRRTEIGISYQHTPTNTINPQSLLNHTLVYGTLFKEPLLVGNLRI